jgi:hypothetical protein
MARSSLDVAILYWIYPYGDFGSEPGSIPVWAIVETGRHEVCLSPGRALFYFYQLILHVVLLVLLLVSATIQEEIYFRFKWLQNWETAGQGHQPTLLRSFGSAGRLSVRRRAVAGTSRIC